jgi:hypothetical protein
MVIRGFGTAVLIEKPRERELRDDFDALNPMEMKKFISQTQKNN